MSPTARVETTFPTNWADSVVAFSKKYPHPKVPHVRDALVLNRKVNANGELVSTRIMCVEQPVPAVLRPLASNSTKFYAVEETVFAPSRKSFQLRTCNLTYDRVISAEERSAYYPTGEPEQTAYVMNVEVACKVPLVGGAVSRALVKRTERNATHGLELMQYLTAKELEKK